MKILRQLILCGCTADTPNRCAHKSWTSGECRCPCHFTQDQTQRLISAYVHNGEGQIAGFMNNLWLKKKETAARIAAHVVVACCGHEKQFDYKPSQMAVQYIQQHPCEFCEEKRLI